MFGVERGLNSTFNLAEIALKKKCVYYLNGPAKASAAALTVSPASVDGIKHKENHVSETDSCMWEYIIIRIHHMVHFQGHLRLLRAQRKS